MASRALRSSCSGLLEKPMIVSDVGKNWHRGFVTGRVLTPRSAVKSDLFGLESGVPKIARLRFPRVRIVVP